MKKLCLFLVIFMFFSICSINLASAFDQKYADGQMKKIEACFLEASQKAYGGEEDKAKAISMAKDLEDYLLKERNKNPNNPKTHFSLGKLYNIISYWSGENLWKYALLNQGNAICLDTDYRFNIYYISPDALNWLLKEFNSQIQSRPEIRDIYINFLIAQGNQRIDYGISTMQTGNYEENSRAFRYIKESLIFWQKAYQLDVSNAYNIRDIVSRKVIKYCELQLSKNRLNSKNLGMTFYVTFFKIMAIETVWHTAEFKDWLLDFCQRAQEESGYDGYKKRLKLLGGQYQETDNAGNSTKVYSSGEYIFKLKPGEETDHWITAKSYMLFSSENMKFRIKTPDGRVFNAWELKVLPRYKDTIIVKLIGGEDDEIKFKVK